MEQNASSADGPLPGDNDSTQILEDSGSDVGAALAAWVGDDNPNALPLGHALHEYSLQAILGSGAFGITYLAHDSHLHCMVAIKEYFPEHLAVRRDRLTVGPAFESDAAEFAEGLQRFLGETRVLASFRHRNIVRVTRFFEANGTAYMVMDYEKGRPLRDWIRENGPLDEAGLLRMFLPLLDGLETVHRAGVLHRDIKPGNLYVRDEDSSLVLLDFGAARNVEAERDRSLTRIVTPGYAPLEQYHSRGELGPWSDIYALGGVLYWIVTGEKPLEAPARVAVDDMPAAATAAAGRYGEGLLNAIDWSLKPDVAKRPPDVASLRRALTGEMGDAVVGVPAPEKKPGRREWQWSFVAAALTLLILGGVIHWSRSSTPVPVVKPVAVLEAPAVGSNPAAAREEPPPADARPKPASADSPAASAAPVHHAAPATLVFNVHPGGTVYVDGRKVGTVPPLKQIHVAPGRHLVEVHGTLPPGVHYFRVDLAANEKKAIRAEFSQVNF